MNSYFLFVVIFAALVAAKPQGSDDTLRDVVLRVMGGRPDGRNNVVVRADEVPTSPKPVPTSAITTSAVVTSSSPPTTVTSAATAPVTSSSSAPVTNTASPTSTAASGNNTTPVPTTASNVTMVPTGTVVFNNQTTTKVTPTEYKSASTIGLALLPVIVTLFL